MTNSVTTTEREQSRDRETVSTAMTVSMEGRKAFAEAEIQKTVERIQKAKLSKKTRSYGQVEVERQDCAQITLPVDMATAEAINWLERERKAEQRLVNFTREYDAYPLDGAHALKLALERVYGFADLSGQASFFGTEPPKKIEVDLGAGETVVVPWGVMTPLGLDGTLTCHFVTEPRMKFVLMCEVRQKDEGTMRAITDLVQAILDHESIYRNRAFKLNYAWRDQEEPNPLSMQPTMMSLDRLGMHDLIVNHTVQTQLETDLLLRLRHTQACVEAGVPLKQGILLAGPYGTGKTLAAKVAANEAVKNGWTFIYLENAGDLPETVELAAHYGPAVIFVEDIDSITQGERRKELNDVLNTIDGIDSKHQPIITVLTTNHVENISKAFLRAGRIDSLIEFTAPDSFDRARFLYLYLAEYLEDYDAPEIEEAIKNMDGMVPAFIAEICRKAKLRAMWRLGRAPEQFEVSPQDVLDATLGMREHAVRADEFGLIEKTRTVV